MAACVSVAPDDSLVLDVVTPVDSCAYIIYESSEYTTIQGFNELFSTYFDIDLTIFSLLITANLVAFVSGHVLGRVLARLKL